MENKIRQTINDIYFGKTKDVVNDLRLGGCINRGALINEDPILATIGSFPRKTTSVLRPPLPPII